ncbi:hypothetical protein LWC05_02205 [Acetobacter sicerae]|uniref:Uncharacterized protein n=1 Tax=Acetobacter sicerae TaxID=85325 RepID=A0ABS8VQ08_9PROT|nr:hypothetical protein [Acetobacter sicerae]MCE0742712.1 hypothetical protein [Acetobacter sicerae]
MPSDSTIFIAGSSLPPRHPTPFKIEDRHAFSPSQSCFDKAVSNERMKFGCFPEYRERIDEVLWLTISDGSPKYKRLFVRDHLRNSGFLWPWMLSKSDEFSAAGKCPKAWVNRNLVPGDISQEDMFEWWIATGSQMTYVVREIEQDSNLLKLLPYKTYSARVLDYDKCEFSDASVKNMQASIPKSIQENKFEDFFPSFPCDGAMIEIDSPKRRLRAT